MKFQDRIKTYTFADPYLSRGLWPFNKEIESEQDTTVKISGKDVLMFGSNSYLGLTNHPYLKAASQKAIDKYGTGCAGSRFLNGTLDLHIELEKRLAAFVGKPKALVFSTGFQVNIGVISCLPGRNDYVILDELDHACIIDGARLSFGKVLKYGHNDMHDLERILSKIDVNSMKLIVVDGIFSMDGDMANLPAITALAERYGATVMVDDAHGLGVLGNKGQGTSAHFGVTDKVELIMGTFSKSLATIGGFIAGEEQAIYYIKHTARSMLFSASLAPANSAAALAALDIIEQEPHRVQKLWENTNYALKRFKDAGVDTGNASSPIIPVLIRDDLKTFIITKKLFERGVFVNPVVTPAVAADASMIRFSLMATHSKEQIDVAIDHIISLIHEHNVPLLPREEKEGTQKVSVKTRSELS